MNYLSPLKFFTKITLAGFGLVAMIAFRGWVLTPDLQTSVPDFDAELVAKAEALRDVRVDTSNPITVFSAADCNEGESATWWLTP